MDPYSVERMQEIREEIFSLLQEAKDILRMDAPQPIRERAKAYWVGHIDAALGGGECIDEPSSMLATIKEMEEEVDLEEPLEEQCPSGECVFEPDEDPECDTCIYCGWIADKQVY
jgi:hypothetical protein